MPRCSGSSLGEILHQHIRAKLIPSEQNSWIWRTMDGAEICGRKCGFLKSHVKDYRPPREPFRHYHSNVSVSPQVNLIVQVAENKTRQKLRKTTKLKTFLEWKFSGIQLIIIQWKSTNHRTMDHRWCLKASQKYNAWQEPLRPWRPPWGWARKRWDPWLFI